MNVLKAANPIAVTKRVFGLAGAAVVLASTAARDAVHAPVGVTRGAIHLAGTAVGRAGTVARETADVLRTARSDEHVTPSRGAGLADVTHEPNIAAGGPQVAPVEPQAPEEPPVDVVGDALAVEAAAARGDGPEGAGIAHEPHGASRDEEHGDAALQRAEVEEIAEEAVAALEGDIEPEEHLTEPVLDSADAKAVAAEVAMMNKAADPDKG